MDRNNFIRININYNLGRYEVSGIVNGKSVIGSVKPIRGQDRSGMYKKNFSREVINGRRRDIKHDLVRMKDYDEDLYDIKNIRNIDTTLYKLLYEFDQFYKTNYSREYLKIMTRRYSKFQGETNTDFKEYCRKKRLEDLENAGILINYDLSLMGEQFKEMTLSDKIRGIAIARRHSKATGAKLNFSFINRGDVRRNNFIVDQLGEAEKNVAEAKKLKVDNNMETQRQLVDRLKKLATEHEKSMNEVVNPEESVNEAHNPEEESSETKIRQIKLGEMEYSEEEYKNLVEGLKRFATKNEEAKQQSKTEPIIETENLSSGENAEDIETGKQSNVEETKTEEVPQVDEGTVLVAENISKIESQKPNKISDDSGKQEQIKKARKPKEESRKKKEQQSKKEIRESKKWKNVYASNKEVISARREENKEREKSKQEAKAVAGKYNQQEKIIKFREKQEEDRRKEREEQARKEREELVRKKQEELVRKKQEEIVRRRQEEARIEKQEKAARKAKEEAERKAKAEAARKQEEIDDEMVNGIQNGIDRSLKKEEELDGIVDGIYNNIIEGKGEKSNKPKKERFTRNKKKDNNKSIKEMQHEKKNSKTRRRIIIGAVATIAALTLLFAKCSSDKNKDIEKDDNNNTPKIEEVTDHVNPGNVPGEIVINPGEETETHVIIEEPGNIEGQDNTEQQTPEEIGDNTEQQTPEEIGDNTEQQIPEEIGDNTEQQTPEEIGDNTEQTGTHETDGNEEDILSQIRVGAKVNFGDVRFYSSPDGTGTSGSLKNYQDAEIRISIIDISAEKLIVVKDSEMSVRDIRNMYPNAKLSYCVYAIRDGVKHDLGWITENSIQELQQDQNESINEDSER